MRSAGSALVMVGLVVGLMIGDALVAAPARAAEPWSAPVFAAPRGPRTSAAPAPMPTDVETAEQLYAKLEFDDANKVAERVVKLRGLTHDQLVRAYKILAVTHAFLDREDASRDAFILLLTYEPDYTADVNLGPKVTQPFVEARGFWRAQPSKPGIEVVAAIRAQEAGALRVTTRDPTHLVRRVAVGWRYTTSGDFTQVNVAVGGGVSVDVPAPPPGKSRVEYYAQALDDRDDVVFETGSPNAPKSALVDTSGVTAAGAGDRQRDKERSGGPSIFSSPVFWTVTGVIVAGGATAAILALRSKGQSAPTDATLTPALQCGGNRCN